MEKNYIIRSYIILNIHTYVYSLCKIFIVIIWFSLSSWLEFQLKNGTPRAPALGASTYHAGDGLDAFSPTDPLL